MYDSLSLVSQAKVCEAEILYILFESHALCPRVCLFNKLCCSGEVLSGTGGDVLVCLSGENVKGRGQNVRGLLLPGCNQVLALSGWHSEVLQMLAAPCQCLASAAWLTAGTHGRSHFMHEMPVWIFGQR